MPHDEGPHHAEAHDVIMPALGMAQDSGVVVRWLKSPGDVVAAGEALFEVETDKATMEVEAQADGYFADLRAEAGATVPVGQIIARIVAVPDDAPGTAPALQTAPPPADDIGAEAALVQRSARGRAEQKDDAQPFAARSPAMTNSAHAPCRAPLPPASSGGRIFASPRARRLAAEAGLDLARLVTAGHPQPYHGTDVEILRALPVEHPLAPAGAERIDTLQITARVPGAEVMEFCRAVRTDGGIDRPVQALCLAFACGALREAIGTAGDLVIEHAPLDGAVRCFLNPDRARLSAQPEAGDGAPPDLILRDMLGSYLIGLNVRPKGAPVLSVGDAGEVFWLSLAFTQTQLNEPDALALMTGFTRRMATPLAYLV